MPRLTAPLMIALSWCLCSCAEPDADPPTGPPGQTSMTPGDDMSEVGTEDMGEDTGGGGEDMDEAPNTLAWPAGEGVWGEPQVTFALPAPEDGKGIYVPDVQERFSDVDWATLDRLYIPAGHYPFIRLGNLPERDAARPLVITNQGGQVLVGGLDHHYLFALGGGSNWVLTGRYDPVSRTGDAGFPGHRGGAFADSQGTYGIVVDDEFVRRSVSGIGIGSGATSFEVEYVEITRVGFAGMLIKTDDEGDAHMEDVRLHDLYIHDVVSEGLYIGSTQSQPQHQIRGIQIFNNRIVRTGTEAIQLGQLGGDSRVHHNVFGPAAIDWRDAFQNFQDGNLQIGIRAGHLEVSHNVFMGAAGNLVGLFAGVVEGDDTSANRGVSIQDNVFVGTRNTGMYINNGALPEATYTIARNQWAGWRFERREVYSDAPERDHLLRIFNSETPIVIEDNVWSGPAKLSNALPEGGNGQQANVTGSGNVEQPIEPLVFVGWGLPQGFDVLNLEQWAESASLGDGMPIAYEQDEVVTHMGAAWRCKLDPCPGGQIPPEHPETWEELGPLSDDVRTVPGSAWEDHGLSADLAR